jgi:uncharacterized membrane protein YphA (DoxX/SURF4 family)
MTMTASNATAPARPAIITVIAWLARILAAALFIYTGWEKLKAPADFAKEIRAYEMVPLEVTNAMALYLPWLEILTGALILIPWFRREARLLILLMLAVFTIAKAAAKVQGLNIHCGCVPKDSPLLFLFEGWTGVTTNVVLLALLLFDWATDRRRQTPAASPAPQPAPSAA